MNEKKTLNETVTKLVSDLKLEEEKFKKNIKAIQDRHLIEIKRAKDAQAASDKIKRDKWMEKKTQKIKVSSHSHSSLATTPFKGNSFKRLSLWTPKKAAQKSALQ